MKRGHGTLQRLGRPLCEHTRAALQFALIRAAARCAPDISIDDPLPHIVSGLAEGYISEHFVELFDAAPAALIPNDPSIFTLATQACTTNAADARTQREPGVARSTEQRTKHAEVKFLVNPWEYDEGRLRCGGRKLLEVA